MKTAINSSPVAQLIRHYSNALDQLGYSYTPEQIESRGLGIHYAMAGSARAFHDVEHILDVARGLRPIQVLAALYHDTIYYQVDQKFPGVVLDKITDVLIIKEGHFFIPEQVGNRNLRLVCEVFDFNPGQELNVFGGMNEFLSAVVAISDLGLWLDEPQVAGVASCIRATIPFQGKDKAGKSFPDRIAATLARLSSDRGWGCSPTQIEEMTRQAIEMGNRDVANFAEEDFAAFLDNTWKLLPEANADLHAFGSYTIRSFRTSLMKMESFLSRLDPNVVFHEYKKFPENFSGLKERAADNLAQAVEYLQAKFLAMTMLEAIAELTGGDAPIMFLAGASKESDPSSRQIQDFLKAPETYRNGTFSGLNERIYNVLSVGRISGTRFDTKASPLAAFIYSVVGEAALPSFVAHAKKAIQEEAAWLEFLRSFPNSMAKDMVAAVAQLCEARTKRCLALIERL